jgi:histidyl-tRNA synthetase
MNDKKQIYKPRPISGFPEWLPEERLVEQRWLDHIRRIFESYGYCSIETPAVEELNVIAAKGEDVDKEIYVLERLHKQEGDKEARLALHFDQTVPFARYVAQHFDKLTYPFKRYQMQKVWRGERPQMGRMREFYQCDIDVINPDNLPLSFDAECAAVMYEVLTGLPDVDLGRVQLRISNRKILQGFLQTYGGSAPEFKTMIFQSVDKLEKLGEKFVIEQIKNSLQQRTPKMSESFILDTCNSVSKFLEFTSSKYESSDDLKENIQILIKENPELLVNNLFNEGIKELAFVMENLSHLPEGAVVADLSIVRGLDYYTGTVYETQLLDVPEFTGSVCSGGRYDDLAGSYINKHLPGVGISIGFSRLFDVMRQTKRLKIGAKSPTHILILLLEETQRENAHTKARALRTQGFNVEVFHAPSKIDKQFKYAEKKLIPFIYVPMDNDAETWEIKNMTARTQTSEAEGMKELLNVRS